MWQLAQVAWRLLQSHCERRKVSHAKCTVCSHRCSKGDTCFALDVVNNHYAGHFLIASPRQKRAQVAGGNTQRPLHMFLRALSAQLATSPCIRNRIPDIMSWFCVTVCFAVWARSDAIIAQGLDVILRKFFGGWTQRLSEAWEPKKTDKPHNSCVDVVLRKHNKYWGVLPITIAKRYHHDVKDLCLKLIYSLWGSGPR